MFEFQVVEKAGGKKEKGTEAGRTWSGVLLTDPRRLEQEGGSCHKTGEFLEKCAPLTWTER